MGTYNPNLPQILGQEWVPIREEPLTLTPQSNLVEVGHRFSLDTSRILQTARFYLREYPPGDPSGQVMLMALYQQGKETLTGPVQSVIIPCSLGTASGGTVTLNDATTIAQALANPSDSAYVLVDTAQQPTITLRFETESYMPLLMGKRILGINFLYANFVSADIPNAVFAGISSTSSTILDIGTMFSTTDVLTSFINTKLGSLTIGEIDWHWNAPITNIIEVLPWTPNRLRCFDNSSGLTDRSVVMIVDTAPTASQQIIFDYAAIEVFFCEEQRIAYGGKRFVGGRGTYILGVNQLTMRDLTDAINPTLSPGDYSLVLSSANLTPGNAAPYPEINQVRQLYDISSHIPVRVIRPYPIDDTAVGKTFSAESTVLVPQLSLNTSGGPFTEVHVYGRQAVAQVYGTVTATQEIYDVPVGASYSYPWVRYYARRFGDTSVPLKLSSPTITGSGLSVEITPAEFDALEEIVDGWKEITLRFDTAPTMGAGTSPQWRWSATGETVGSRWEVLGAIAPALSGAPGNLLNLAPSPNQLSIATYGMPVSGANINLGWIPQYAPPVSATVDDQTSDAALIFARDMPTITGFGTSIEDQEVTGIGLDCGVDPCCIPSEIQYVNLTWTPAQTLVLADTFTRATVSNGWGVAESGQPWVVSAASAGSVAGGLGIHTFSGSTDIYSYVVNPFSDTDITARLRLDQTPSGNDVAPGLMARQTAVGNTYYRGDMRVSSAGVIILRIQRAVAGVFTTLTQSTLGLTFDTNQFYHLRFQLIGSILRLRFWLDGETQPTTWNLVTSDTSITTGATGVVTSALSGNTNSGAHVFFDDILAGPPYALDTKVELQRKDTVETDWATIMMATNPAISGFRDYEARVGIQSTYRVRNVDIYDFPGPWSSEVTATVTAPGVTIGCDDGHLLIFTSNEEQDGSLNLAYSSVWEAGRTVEEDFTFAEANFVQLQAMYNRDFFTAFRPTERGGERFQRTILVQAAAIAPETLADFTSLRDMAWADVPYICVRDEDGNRWFATVLVPSGRVLRDRRLYMAPVDVIEVTATPSQVDP